MDLMVHLKGHDYGLALQQRVIQLLCRGVEGVQVGVDDVPNR